MPTEVDHVATLPDGRDLAYRDEGDRDLPVVIFNPGFMACRLTGRPVPGARVVTVDRPGIGRSDPKADRTVLQWVDDVAALADHLGLGTFAVLGHSAGSAYAAACAYRLGSRVTALGIACGFAPMDRPGATDGVNRRMAKAIPGLRRAPWTAHLATASLRRGYRRDPEKAFHRQFARDLPDCDLRALDDQANRGALLDAAVESARQGRAPLALEMQLVFARPWGFDPGAISVPTRLWYGADDTLTPPQMGRYLETAIGGAQLVVFPGEGHMAAFTHWDQIVGALATP